MDWFGLVCFALVWMYCPFCNVLSCTTLYCVALCCVVMNCLVYVSLLCVLCVFVRRVFCEFCIVLVYFVMTCFELFIIGL